MSETGTDVVVGIDVGKARVDVAVLPSGTQWTVTNTAAGVRQLVARLQAVGPGLTIVEATGGYERTLVNALTAATLPLVVTNPRQVRAFARAIGQLVNRQLVEMRTAETNRLRIAPPGVQADLRRHPQWLDRRLVVLSRRNSPPRSRRTPRGNRRRVAAVGARRRPRLEPYPARRPPRARRSEPARLPPWSASPQWPATVSGRRGSVGSVGDGVPSGPRCTWRP